MQRRKVHRLTLIGGASAFAVLGVVAWVSPSPAANSAPARARISQVIAQPLPPHDVEPEAPDYVRASGRVGSNLTDALKQAGVPDRMGIDTVWRCCSG